MVKTAIIGLVFMLALAVAGPTAAQDEMAASVGLDLVSDYVWRGQLRNGDGALQPWVEVGYGGFRLNLWSSMDLDETPNDAQWEFTEVDLTGGYTIPIGGYALEVGAIYYSYPNQAAENTIEVFGTFTFTDVVPSLSPYVAVYYDLDEIDGLYFQAGAIYRYEMETVNLEAKLWIGAATEDYNEGYFGVSDFALNDLTAIFKVEVPFSTAFSVNGFISGSWLLDSEIQDVADDSNYAFGAGVSYSF